MPESYFIIEASHLFRAGEMYSTQVYVVDVVNYLSRVIYNTPPTKSWVLFGSTKDAQAEKYTAAVEKTGVIVIRMEALDSRLNNGAKFYKPSSYLINIFNHIPKGSNVMMVGLHNTRFEDIFKMYNKSFNLSLAAFTTKSRSGMSMGIPTAFSPLLVHTINLDNHIDGIKGEYKRLLEESKTL